MKIIIEITPQKRYMISRDTTGVPFAITPEPGLATKKDTLKIIKTLLPDYKNTRKKQNDKAGDSMP